MLGKLIKIFIILGFSFYSYGLIEDEKKRKQLIKS